MEEEERKQKLKAGKEKLARFQKKKKKKPREFESDEQLSDVRRCGADDGALAMDLSSGASPVPFDSELQSLSSFSEDDVSGTEEEAESRTVLLVKSQLRDKTERVAELEENLAGKQLALDKVIEENQKLQQTIAEINKQGVQDNNDNVIPSVPVSQSVSQISPSVVAGSQSTEMSEDQSEILNVNQSAGTQSENIKQTYSIADVQELIQHVQWLQLQLKQAGTTLQVQAEKQVTTTQALQQAKSDILSMQDNIVTKDAIVSQLAEKLTTISTEYGKLKASVYTSTTKAVNVPDDLFGAVDSNNSDFNENVKAGYIEQINRLTEELEKLKERGSLEKQDLVKALTFLKESNENALKENEQLKLKNEEINDTLKAVSIEKTVTDDGLKSATQKLDDLFKEIEKLKHEQVIADQEKLVLSEEIETLKLSNSSMSQEIQDLTSTIQDANEGMKQLSVELIETRELKEKLEEELEGSKNQIESIILKNGSILNDNESLGAELEIRKSQCQLHENQISEYQLQIEEYENKISEASDAVEENHSLRTQNDELYNKINNQKDVIASLKAESENVVCKNMQLIEQLQDVSSSEALFKHNTDVLQQDKVGLQEEVNGLSAILSTAQEENTKYKDTLAALKLEIDTLKQELQCSYSECERYKITLSEIQSKDQYGEEMKEQFFVKDSACWSESVNPKLSKTPNEYSLDEQSALSPPISADETFLTATDMSRLESSIIVHENSNKNTDSSTDGYTLDQSGRHTSIIELQNENKALKKELFRLQAGSLVKSAIDFAEASLQLENENFLQSENGNPHIPDARQQNEKQSQCFGKSVLPSNESVPDIVLDDTAYNTYVSEEPEQSDTVTQEIVTLKEKMRTLQQEYDNNQRLLLMKEEECQILNTELEHFKIKTGNMDNPVFLAENLDMLEPVSNTPTTEGNAAVYLDATELEVLRGQYDSQLEGLRAELGNIRDRPPDDDTDRGGTGTIQEQYKQIQEKLGQGLAGEQKEQLDTLMSDMDKNYQEKVTEMHEKHVDEVENQVKAMRVTLEEIYNGQLELARSELDQSHQVALVELRESLDKEHKEEMNRLEQEWNNKFEDLKQDFDRELRESKLEDSLGKEDKQEFISQLNKKLSEEHKQILKKIEEDLEKESAARGWSPRHPHRSHDTQTDYEADDTESVRSAPVTQEEFEHIEEREKVLGKAEDVRKTLDSQYEDIIALRTQMLGEYEQLLSVRTEVMASQTQEVEQLQQEMAAIQHQYEEQMKTFQAKVEAQTEAALKSRLTEEHTKEVEELKQFYESKVSQMEEQLQSLRQDADGLPSSSEKERDYVRKTTMLTTISDTEETPPPSPTRGSDMYEINIKSLEDKLKDRDKLIDELKKRLEAETASAEDLHGQLLDSNNKLCEFEDSLKARGEELEELKAVLLVKDTKINTLENEKAEWEEKGEKEIEGKIIGELKHKIKKLEEELSTSKEAESRIRQELNQLNSQHQEAIIALKNEMENINKNKIIELESEFKIRLEQELDKQAKEIANKHIEELHKQKSELENIQKSETDLKEKLDSVESSHAKQLNELKEKYEGQLRDSLVTSTVTLNDRESAIEPELVAETKVIPKTAVRESGSPITSKKTSSEAELEKIDRDSIEAAIRAEILVEYEQSIDKLKSEYEERISHLNTKLQSYETQGAQQISVIDSESVPSKVESSIREKLRIELAKEYKEKLQNVTEDYESKLKHLQAQIDTKTPVSVSPVSDTRDTQIEPSRETVVKSPTEKTPGKIPKEYEGYVSTIRKDYEDKIVALQTEIAQYKTSAVPSPLSPKLKEPDSQTLVKEINLTADAGLDIDPQTVKLRQEMRETVSAEYETAFETLKSDYEKQLKELSDKVSSLQSESPGDSDIEMKVRAELSEEYDKKLTTLENQCESKLAELTQKLENAMGEKTTAEQKVKADMFVWHEEIVTQLKRKHEDNITQINKEYEEKMDLLREEMQEEFDAEREKMLRHHKQEIMDYEDRYENLLEGLRTGDAPDVAAIVQEKFDMELEMAKTLIQQECEETIESEQSRLSEQHEYEIEKLLAEKEEALEEQSTKFDKDMADLKNTLLKQYEDQIHEMEARHEEAMTKAKEEFETLVEKAKLEARETAELEKKPKVEAETETATQREDQEPESVESELVRHLKQKLFDKEQEYTIKIEELKAVHEEEISQLMKDLQDKDTECEEKIRELEEKHIGEIAEYQEKVEQLQQDIQKKAGADTTGEDTEALELAHQQELQDLEDRLTDKHRKEKDNLETQFKSRLDDIEEKHKLEIERLKNDLLQAQQALDQYPDIQEEVMSPAQAVPTFHAADSTLGSTREVSQDDFMVPTQTTSVESAPDSRSMSLKETEAFEAQSTELITEEKELSLQGTLDDTGLQSLETEQTPRGSLRGVDDTIESGELIHFSEEEESDKSEGGDTKTDRSTPTELMQTLGYGTVITGGPTVKSLDDTSESSVRVSDREDQSVRIRELEVEVDDLRKKLQHEMSKQDVQHDRLDREKQEESNLVAMLQVDIERLNNDREALQNTNEHLLGLLSDAVKTYMNIDDSISKKLKTMMEKPIDKSADTSGDRSGDKGRPRSAEGKRTPTRRSPQLSPSDRHSPAREEGADGDNIQNTSVVSNVTDEGLDLSQRISDSIFQGPDLASEEEELLQDSGSRLQTSVTKLLDMIDETTSQLLDTKQTQAELMETLDSRGQDLDRLTSRCNDLEERLREEVERKDFLALELHKAEGLIEGYSSERDQQDRKIQDLEEQKENLVLELETMKNKLMDMDSTQEENESLRKEIHDQQELITSNVGEEAQALMLEVTRLHSENREKEHHIKQVQERYESRVRELENSGEDMEGHYFKLLDEKKQEVVDLRMQVDALEKQLKAKKQFIEEQANEREQEHEDYQKEVDKWKKIVQDIEKHNGYESRLQAEVDDLTEQLQSRIELHNQAVLAGDKFQSEIRDKDLSITELKAIIQQLEAEIQDKMQEAESDKQKLQHLEQELSQRPYPDDELSEGARLESADDKKTESPDYLASLSGQKQDRVGTQISVEDELRLAAEKTKEDVVREKHALQVQVNELLKQISGLRNQLDEMRHRTDFSDPSEATKRLQAEREKSEEKDKEISELKLQVESLGERVENREQQIQQLAGREEGQDRTGGEEVDMRVKEMETQVHALKAENKQLRERVQLAGETSSVTDISGLSQNLLEEKNQEIDHLSEQLMRVRTEFQELRAEKGVENMYDELESLREELKQKEREIEDIQSVKVSQAFTDHSITPEGSMMNIGASFSEKASIQQELEESEAQRLQRVASLEAELLALRTTLGAKEEEIVTLQEQIDSKRLGQEDASLLQEIIDEKEQLITQLTEQTESLQVEMENLSDFQTKLQEDFDTVQVMLEDKEREIEQLTKELTDKSPESTDEHAVVIKHEIEISRLKKQLREKDNVVEEKMEELAELSDKLETYEIDIQRLKDSESEKDDELTELKKQLNNALSIKPPPVPLSEEEKDRVIAEKEELVEKLQQQVTTMLGRPPSPPKSEDEKWTIIQEQKEEIENLKQSLESALGRPPSPPLSEDEQRILIKEQKVEIETLKQNLESLASEGDRSVLVQKQEEEIKALKEELEAVSLGRPPSPPLSEDQKMIIIKQQKLELETMRKQVDAALLIKPPSPPRSDDEKSEIIYQQEQEIGSLKKQVEAALQISPPPPPMTEDEKGRVIEKKEEEIVVLRRELDKLGEAISSGGEERLLNEKVQEVVNLHRELTEVRDELKYEQVSVKEIIEKKDIILKEKETECEKLCEDIEKLKEELQSLKEVKSYEDEIELKEKEDEIEQLQLELDSYRSREGSLIDQAQTELGESQDSKQLVRSMSFYKDQYEEKCSEARQLQVSLDIAKEKLEKIQKEQSADLTDEIELLKVEIQREKKKEIQELEEIKDTLEKEREEKDQEILDLKRELTLVKERTEVEAETRLKDMEKEIEKAKDEAAHERRDSVQTLKDMEEFRERKEKERKDTLKTIQQLERDLDEKTDNEKKLNKQIKQLNEELTQYRGEEPKSPDSFEMGRDVQTLQKQVEAFKKQADRTKEVLAEKQKYQSQVIQLEIKYENLQKQMRKGVSDLESQMKTFAAQPDQDVWEQLKITQERLDKTAEQLSETADKLNETEGKLNKVSNELASREEEISEVQQDLWKTSGLLSITSGKLQETEEKLRQSVAQVTEREEQIHQLQGELQDTEKIAKKASPPGSPTQQHDIDKLKQQLSTKQAELEQVKQSLKEAVDMNEQQLQMTEQKDQEFVKLKLDIQQTIADKDKTIKEQKQKIKGIEHKEQEITSKERQMEKMKQEAQQALATKDRQIGKLREDAAQLQRQLQELRLRPDGAGGDNAEVIKQQLESELKKHQSDVMQKEQEIERLHQRYEQARQQEIETVDALQNQLSRLQEELQEARAAVKSSDTRVKGQGQGEGQSDRQGQESATSAAREGISDEAEKHIQQLRRELLIAKTALIQIQRGEGFDRGRSPVEDEAQALVQEVMLRPQEVRQQETLPGQRPSHAHVRFEQLPDYDDVPQLQAELHRTREELELFRNSSSLSARDFVQKVMDLKDELSSEHQRHIEDISARASQDAETQLAAMRIKYEDEIEQLRQLHGKEMDHKLRDQLNTLERKHKSETNKLVLRYQEQIELLKTRAGPDIDTTGIDLVGRLQDEVASTERLDRQQLGQRQDGVGQDRNIVNGHPQPTADGMSSKLQNLLRRLHSEGVQVLSISELQYLNRNLSPQDIPRDADIESLKAGWENERQSYLSTIQSLKDLLAQTHKLRGLDKSIEGSDWRAELLRAIGYVFSKEREALLAELRSHVLSHPDANLDDIQRLEQKIRNQEAHHHSAMDQIFAADRQSQLAEIRDLRAHATISRMHHQEEKERLSEKLANAEDHGSKKERQLKRQVQLLEFKIQQEKVLQDDLRTSLDAERARSGTLSGQLNQEKSSNLDLQSNVSGLQVQVGKLKDTLEREQSRFVSVTLMWNSLVNALEEEKSKSLNLSELLESERQTLYRVQSEFEALRRAQESQPSIRHLEELQGELKNERERRCQADSRHEIDLVTMENLRQEVDMQKRHQQAIQKEYDAKTYQLQRMIDNHKQKVAELDSALERERTLTLKLQQSLEAEKSQQETTGRERKLIEDLQIQLETERGKVHDLNNALQREHKNIEEVMSSADSEKRLLQEHLDQEREVNHHLKHDLDALQIEKLEVLSKYDKEHEQLDRLKAERDQMNEELKNLRILEAQRDRDREAEKLADKKAIRQADREKEEYRMKLHEQELETQRLTQKSVSLEEQIAELQENELKAIRELEQERLRNLQAEEEAREKEAQEPSPRSDDGNGMTTDGQAERQERWQVYRSQLESMCQSLHYLVLRCREQLSKSSHSRTSQSDVVDFDALHSSLRDLLNEVKQLQEIEGDFMSHPSGSVNERILRHNEELTNFVARSSEEKNELRNALSRLEEEIWRYRQKDQEVQRASSKADESLLKERAGWAKERLSLQMSLNTAEREMDQLQTDLRVERERRVAAGITDTKETDKVKIQRLYGKYLRAESFRKALIYQKKYLLLLLGGFQDTEETTLALLARMGATPAIESLHHRHLKLSPITTFRSAVRVVIAITRMKYLVRKWKRATRVGSEVVGGTVDQMNGYMPDSGSFSPPRHPSSPRFMPSTSHTLSSSSPRTSYHYTPPRLPDPLVGSSRSQLEVDTVLPSSYPLSRGTYSQVHTTPPTKDYSSTTRYTSPSSGARRKILTTPQTQLAQPGRARFATQEAVNGDYGSHDDYINRLENLQTRLGNLQNALTGLSGGSKMTLIAV